MTEKQKHSTAIQEGPVIAANWQYTRCPECQAVFRVDHNKLSVRKGEVRCGACRGVFHAPSNKVFRNHGGGFSALISEPAEQPVKQAGPMVRGADKDVGMDAKTSVSEGDPSGATFTTPIVPTVESSKLFSEELVTTDSDDSLIEGGSRLFSESDDSIETESLNISSTETTKKVEQEIVIPKISSEPLVSRLPDKVEEYRREPVITSASAETSSLDNGADQLIPSSSGSLHQQSETVLAAREELLFRPLSQIEDEVDHKSTSEIARSPASLTDVDEADPKWNDARVAPYGATAMQLPPQFEPFVPDPIHVPEPFNTAGTLSKEQHPVEDSLLDHNPFSSKVETVTEPHAMEIKVEPRPAAINMSGVDEYIVDRPNPLAGFFWFLVSTSFVVLLGLQVKYFLVERFAQDESYRPYLQVFCGIARCELPPRRDAFRFTITQTRVDLHPQEPGALRITVRLLNQAKFAQPYPDLRLTLTDRVGRVVGRRKFDPGFYLPKGAATRLASGELGYVVFDLAQPHEKAVGFVVDVVRRAS